MSSRQDRSSPVSSPGPAAALQDRLAPVLADLRFPARRWQVLTVADLYGVDTTTRSMLELLPERPYQAMPEIAGVLAAVLAGRPVASAGPPGPPPGPRPVRAAPRSVVRSPVRPVPSTPVA